MRLSRFLTNGGQLIGAAAARPELLPAAAAGSSRADWSRELLQDGGDAQIVGVVAVGALRGGVAEPRGQAALAEQPGCLFDEVIEVVKHQYLFSDRRTARERWRGNR